MRDEGWARDLNIWMNAGLLVGVSASVENQWTGSSRLEKHLLWWM